MSLASSDTENHQSALQSARVERPKAIDSPKTLAPNANKTVSNRMLEDLIAKVRELFAHLTESKKVRSPPHSLQHRFSMQ